MILIAIILVKYAIQIAIGTQVNRIIFQCTCFIAASTSVESMFCAFRESIQQTVWAKEK